MITGDVDVVVDPSKPLINQLVTHKRNRWISYQGAVSGLSLAEEVTAYSSSHMLELVEAQVLDCRCDLLWRCLGVDHPVSSTSQGANAVTILWQRS